jgi:hypothetical protein
MVARTRGERLIRLVYVSCEGAFDFVAAFASRASQSAQDDWSIGSQSKVRTENQSRP